MANRIVSVHAWIYAIMLPSSGVSFAHLGAQCCDVTTAIRGIPRYMTAA